jgi:hypothetical protein
LLGLHRSDDAATITAVTKTAAFAKTVPGFAIDPSLECIGCARAFIHSVCRAVLCSAAPVETHSGWPVMHEIVWRRSVWRDERASPAVYDEPAREGDREDGREAAGAACVWDHARDRS